MNEHPETNAVVVQHDINNDAVSAAEFNEELSAQVGERLALEDETINVGHPASVREKLTGGQNG